LLFCLLLRQKLEQDSDRDKQKEKEIIEIAAIMIHIC
jgi:hypothetical protein